MQRTDSHRGNKLLAFSAILALSITLGVIPIAGQRKDEPPNAGRLNQSNSSQPPAPAPLIGTQAPQQQPTTKNGSPGNRNAPVPAPFSPQQGQQPSQGATPQNQQSPPNWWNWFTNNGANWAIVALTFVLAGIGVAQWWATHTANKHNAIIERAYVTMAHEAPGIRFIPEDGPPTAIQASIKITNTGHTPADILEMRWVRALNHAELVAERDQLPPPRTGSIVMSLMPNDSFMYWQHLEDVSPDILAQIHAGTNPLWIVGSVTYLNRFDGRRHRQGYGRRFIHQMLPGGNNNLVFMVEDAEFRQFHREEDLDLD